MTFIDFGCMLGQKVKRPVATCGALWDGSPPPKERIARSSWGPPDLDGPMLRSPRLGDDGDDDADDADDEGIDGKTPLTLELRGIRWIS